MLNLKNLRDDTLGTAHHIHLNNAGASLPPNVVVDRMIKHLLFEQQIGGYEAQASVDDELNDFYVQAARLINCEPDEIAFSESATNGWQRFFYSVPLTKSDRVITFQNEYASNFLSLLRQQERYGFAIDVIPSDREGNICLATLEKKMNDDVKIVLLAHMPSQSGQLTPARAIGEIVKRHDALFILDATQTIGQYPIDVKEIPCDVMCATGRKFLRGPRGSGFLFVRRAIAERTKSAVIDLQSAQWTSVLNYRFADGATRFENWECNVAAKLGLKEAMRYANQLGMENIWRRGQTLSTRLREGLKNIPTARLCDPGTTFGNIVTVVVEGMPCADVVQKLAKEGIAINRSLREYALLDFGARNQTEVCRISPHYYNSEDEIDRALDAIRSCAY